MLSENQVCRRFELLASRDKTFGNSLEPETLKMFTTMLTFSHCNTKRFFLMWMPPSFSIHLQEIFFSSLVTKKRALPS